ncbi:TIGR00366 family protein [Clostridium beijerinckii]|jgi:Short chain fatty acids transporter|uniref:Short-chain fatty acids transporter n=2 Tax=Clostridium beijerinckii TaxID=1520 RepID=A0A1S8RF83_CLOBE|nr:TIGR00366 family protein [Clostridium beijerinckii]ABR35937.1 short chain fatty acid transporter [Clostridium beijerinckii NCIMB 8052]AIU03820.1 short chain fatty acid transporter [Clostridium beijerinckii ATCC 35702]MBF7809425.1 TIGR00366 family protein [Clostridium beijerinckii]NRT23020.1 short-chain fatty acids transporter [Clostridium beijerinckii]NRT69820.1 short-chain fatty acids transporter [Clostridium beijerinckii]
MIKGLSKFFTAIVQKFLPDPLVFAMILTLIMFVSGIIFTGHTPIDMIGFWGKSFWNLLAFGMQMALILVTGSALASSPPVKRILEKIASLPKTPAQAIMLVTFAAAVANIVNWGFGLIVGALLAKEVAKKVPRTDYRLLIASAYIGFMTWHGGLSGSVPLLAATKGNPMEKAIGLIPLSQTIFAPYNIFITVALIVILPLMTRMMMPKDEDVVEIDPALLAADAIAATSTDTAIEKTFAVRVENSRVIAWLIGILGISYMVCYFMNNGTMDVNAVNMIMFFAGIILHGSPLSYMQAVVNGAKGTAGIMVQFPFYAGIQGMMDLSGLGGMITSGFVSISNVHTFPVLAFLSSGLINFFVPSGGGHWVVQGPFIMPAAQALGADMGKAAMAIAYGEAWMNMAQPFWALPALAIAGLKVRDIMGFCVTTLIVGALIFGVGLALF